MTEQLQISFDKEGARGYMVVMAAYDNQRDELNMAINEARKDAKDRGVPTRAVEAAIRAAKGRRKSSITSVEFQALIDMAEEILGRE